MKKPALVILMFTVVSVFSQGGNTLKNIGERIAGEFETSGKLAIVGLNLKTKESVTGEIPLEFKDAKSDEQVKTQIASTNYRYEFGKSAGALEIMTLVSAETAEKFLRRLSSSVMPTQAGHDSGLPVGDHCISFGDDSESGAVRPLLFRRGNVVVYLTHAQQPDAIAIAKAVDTSIIKVTQSAERSK